MDSDVLLPIYLVYHLLSSKGAEILSPADDSLPGPRVMPGTGWQQRSSEWKNSPSF
jgi:hypothetical protein